MRSLIYRGLLGMFGIFAATPGHAQTLAALDRSMPAPAAASEAAITRAQIRYALPPGLLLAIGLAESGRADPATKRMRPWPWAVQAGSRSLYFETRAEAVAWVQNAQASGTTSVDTGCLQVNLMFHPRAFATVDAAFDPEGNVDYAARFLISLHDETRDWGQAIGFYHSRTPALASPYQQRVQVNMGLRPGGGLPEPLRASSVAEQLAVAWGATVASAPDAAPTERDWSTLLQRHPAAHVPAPMAPHRMVAVLSSR